MPRGKTSIVWDHFSHPDAQNLVVCQICKAALAYCNSTGSLIKHLKFKHPLLWPSMVAAHDVSREAAYCSSLSPVPPSKKPKLEPAADVDGSVGDCQAFQLPVPDMPHLTASSGAPDHNAVVPSNGSTFVVQLNNGLYEMLSMAIVTDLRPVKFVSQPGIRDLIQSLSPACSFPSVSEISEYLKLKYLGAKSTLLYRISDAIEKACRFAVTCRFRQSAAGERFVSVGVRYITDDWQGEYFVLETHPLPPDGASIDALVTSTMESYNIPSSLIQGYVVGHGNVKGLPKYEDSLPSKAVDCFGDKLEHVVSASLQKSDEVAEIVKAAKRLMTRVKTEAIFNQVLKTMRQRGGNWPPENYDTWIGLYELFDCLLLHEGQISSVIADYATSVPSFSQNQGLDLSESDWKILREVAELLKPFKAAVEFLSTNPFCPVSACPLLLAGLERFTRSSKRQQPVVDSVRDALHERLTELTQFTNCDAATLATALDPRFCKLKHLSRVNKTIVHESISTLCSSYAVPTPEYRSPSPADNSMLGNLLGLESTDACVWSDSDDEEGGIINEEVARYFRTSSANKVTDPLRWWQAKEDVYPVLARLAKQYLCLPATVADSSSVFSAAPGTVDVETENMDVVVFLNENRALLEDCGLNSSPA